MKLDEVHKKAIAITPWYQAHKKSKKKLTTDQLEWLSNLSAKDKVTMSEFPIYCVVWPLDKKIDDALYPEFFGIVCGYKDGYAVMKKNPDSTDRFFARPDHIQKICHWNGMTARKLQKAIEWHECKTKKVKNA